MIIIEDYGNEMYSNSQKADIVFAKNIAKQHKRIDSKKVLIEDLENELYLLKKQTFDMYKKNIRYPLLCFDDIINKACNWISERDNVDKRKKSENKDAYEFIQNVIRRYIGYKVDITSISREFQLEYINVYFEYSGMKFSIEIPNISHISFKSFDRYGDNVFQIKIKTVSECVHTVFGSTLDEDKLHDIFKKHIDDAFNKKDGDANA